MRESPTILCVTRAYPPVVGGMETLSGEFTRALARKTQTFLLANRHGKGALPLFLPYAALRMRQLITRIDVIHLGDPLLTALLPFLFLGGRRQRGRPPVAVTIHGLDILYPNPLYQALLYRFLPDVDLALCISRFVETEMNRRFPTVKTTVSTPGLQRSFAAQQATRHDLERALTSALGDGPLLLTVARLVKRKGIAWFTEHVLPHAAGARLLVIGDGPERSAILEAARRVGVADRLTLAGTVPESALRLAYATADLFVLPNIPVPGDAEGFGLVALEAAAAGLPVLAANLEGIRDAVVEGETGRLLPPGQPDAWRTALTELIRNHAERARLAERAPTVVRERFAWDQIADQLLATFSRLVVAKRGQEPFFAAHGTP